MSALCSVLIACFLIVFLFFVVISIIRIMWNIILWTHLYWAKYIDFSLFILIVLLIWKGSGSVPVAIS